MYNAQVMIFREKKEYNSSEKDPYKKEIRAYLELLDLINSGKYEWLNKPGNEEIKKDGEKEIAEGILKNLPPDVKSFKLSEDVIATSEDVKNKEIKKIDDSEIKDLEWVKKLCDYNPKDVF